MKIEYFKPKISEPIEIEHFAAKGIGIDTIRKWIELFLQVNIIENEKINKDKKITIGIAKKGQMRIDCTPNKRRGVLRAPFSLHSATGLVAVPLSLNEVKPFKREDATIKKVLKKFKAPKITKEEIELSLKKKREYYKKARFDFLKKCSSFCLVLKRDNLSKEIAEDLNDISLSEEMDGKFYIFFKRAILKNGALEYLDEEKIENRINGILSKINQREIYLPTGLLVSTSQLNEINDTDFIENEIKIALDEIRLGAITIKIKRGKDFLKYLRKGYRAKAELNTHYTYGKQKKIKYKGKWFTRKHFDLRLEYPYGDLTAYYYLAATGTEKERREKVKKMKKEELYPDSSYLSFAIPKAKFPKGSEKIMISRTADHPLDYSKGYSIGEGWWIPEEEYGGGFQELTDRGEWIVLDISSERVVFYLKMKKMKGAFAIVHLGRPGREDFLLVRLKEQRLEKLKEKYKIEGL